VSLPSGLGAGGRGKEKAPCRYLHYEVDWDGPEAGSGSGNGNGTNGAARGPKFGGGQVHTQMENAARKRKPYKLGIGMGPDGKNMKVVRIIVSLVLL
jgi:mRNA m6A methyltransferase catalytic subunit